MSKERIGKISCVSIDNDDSTVDLTSILCKKLDGLGKLSGEEVTEILLTEIHDKRIHREFPDRHSDIIFHAQLLLDRLGIPNGQLSEVAGRIKEAFKESLLKPLFFEDSVSFLDGAKAYGLKLCMATANFASEKVKTIETHCGKKYFTAWYDETILNQSKLNPAFYEEMLIRLNYSASEAVCIGDSLLDDIIPARLAGLTTIWLNRKGIHVDQPLSDFEVRSLDEAMIILKKLREVD